ncbi:Glutaminyl-peptide cyclotransferase [Glycine soja]
MGTKSLKRRPRESQNPPMAAVAPPRRKPRSYAKASVVLSVLLVVSVIALLVLSSNKLRAFQRGVSYETITVVNVFPHDPQAFTQGLVYDRNDTLFESTGLYGKSSVRKVALHTGKVEDVQKMDSSLFGEGLTLLNNRLFQVTWLQKAGFIYNPKNLRKIGTFNHAMKDGWGLATDGKVLFGSDGSSTLYQIDPQTFKALSKQVVHYKGHQVHNLNELEYINGEVWANVFMTDCIVRISPSDGNVLGWILLQNLRKELIKAGNNDIDVLNGIAWDGEQKRIFVTGKLWPKLCCAFQCGVSYDTITVLNAFPHDPQAFTEGLLYHGNDTLFESTGLYGESSVRKVALRTGKVENIQKMDDSLFGEGLALLNNRLFQLNWLQKDGFIYEPKNLSQIGTFKYDMKEGWGLATDGKVLFGSDGSSTLYQFEPQPFKVVSKQVVYYKGHQVHNLNELEYINGEVWANVLPTDCIVRISPHDGRVLGWILLQNLRKELVEAGEISDRDFLNGIAWDGEQNRIFVTGKLWPKLYEIKEDNILNGIAWDGEQKRIFVTGKLWPKLYEIKVSPIKEPIEEGTIEQLCLPEPYVPPSNLVLADPAQRE